MNYNSFLKINVEHEYSDFQLCPSLRLQPTKESTYWLNHHKCITFYGPGSIKISKHIDINVKKSITLDFFCFCSDPNFSNYTLFENESIDRIPVYNCKVSKDNNVRIEYLWEKWDSLFAEKQCLKPCFIVKVQILPHVQEEQKVSIRLSSKKVYAKYYIMGEFAQTPTQIMDISCSQEKVSFNKLQEDLPVKAQSFISDRPIPLQRENKTHFQLQEQGSSKILLSKLPDVNPKSLVKAWDSNGSAILIAETLIL